MCVVFIVTSIMNIALLLLSNDTGKAFQADIEDYLQCITSQPRVIEPDCGNLPSISVPFVFSFIVWLFIIGAGLVYIAVSFLSYPHTWRFWKQVSSGGGAEFRQDGSASTMRVVDTSTSESL